MHGLACQWSAEATNTGAWHLVGNSHVTQFVARGGSVEGGSVKNQKASRMRSGSGGRACLSVHSGVAGLSGSIRDTPVQPKRLSRVGLSGCPRCLLSCVSCRWWRSRSSHHRDTMTNDYAACLNGCPIVKTSTLNTCSCGSFIYSLKDACRLLCPSATTPDC